MEAPIYEQALVLAALALLIIIAISDWSKNR